VLLLLRLLLLLQMATSVACTKKKQVPSAGRWRHFARKNTEQSLLRHVNLRNKRKQNKLQLQNKIIKKKTSEQHKGRDRGREKN
jgi:hypothetical protein